MFDQLANQYYDDLFCEQTQCALMAITLTLMIIVFVIAALSSLNKTIYKLGVTDGRVILEHLVKSVFIGCVYAFMTYFVMNIVGFVAIFVGIVYYIGFFS